MTEKKYVVTGGTGFIGSNLANHLAEKGHEVVAVDNQYLGDPSNLDDAVEFVDADVRDDDLPIDEATDAVFHLGALSSLDMHEDDPVEGCEVNVTGFVNTVEQARDAGCETIVYASTSSVYGTHHLPVEEATSVTANTAYEASKLARERYAEYYDSEGLQMVGLRLFSVYGGVNEMHKEGYANIITQFAQKIYNDERPEIFGDGEQTRDFVHIDDVCRAFESATTATSGIYNVSGRSPQTFNAVVSKINDEFSKEIEPKYIPNPYGDDYVAGQNGDIKKLMYETGWRPKIKPDEGVERICEFMRNRDS